MRAGDTVKHRPSGETWCVAYVEGDYLAWYGWPPGEAKVSDCELIEACSDAEHEASLRKWAVMANTQDCDRRSAVCRRQLFNLLGGFVGAGI